MPSNACTFVLCCAPEYNGCGAQCCWHQHTPPAPRVLCSGRVAMQGGSLAAQETLRLSLALGSAASGFQNKGTVALSLSISGRQHCIQGLGRSAQQHRAATCEPVQLWVCCRQTVAVGEPGATPTQAPTGSRRPPSQHPTTTHTGQALLGVASRLGAAALPLPEVTDFHGMCS